MGNKVGIYVHVPFCATKCPYCDFYSERYSKDCAEHYIDAVVADMQRYEGAAADTLYFGGGTPSLIEPKLIARVIEQASKLYDLTGEITLEANPNTLSKERLVDYKAMGVNRLSMGMQSVNQAELDALGRRHRTSQLIDSVENAVASGIGNISLDVMVGTPYQTAESLRTTLATAFALPITHISAYMLKVEQGTQYENSPLIQFCADEDEICDLYEDMVSLCNSNGFLQYEISNFAKAGYESVHNLKYWQLKEYIGLGASAHSFFQGKRFYYESSIANYIDKRTVHFETVDPLLETIMLSLRLNTGLQLSAIPIEHHQAVLAVAKKLSDYLELSSDRLVLTTKGMLLSSAVIERICSACNI